MQNLQNQGQISTPRVPASTVLEAVDAGVHNTIASPTKMANSWHIAAIGGLGTPKRRKRSSHALEGGTNHCSVPGRGRSCSGGGRPDYYGHVPAWHSVFMSITGSSSVFIGSDSFQRPGGCSGTLLAVPQWRGAGREVSARGWERGRRSLLQGQDKRTRINWQHKNNFGHGNL
ncbi:uncharacterized protein LOC119630116 isoform X1 [Bombyx mori]|uniref:Uncharacterized protein n=2 Tax=Bombyx mori TaxID=7091 RepID=A0A8R2R438_BOMMO|nr:uncharacterized protein LOC119630116 isoform X1 [Bombyx mori]